MKIISFSKVVPYEGVPHAGGEYFLRHLKYLLEAHEVVVVAPESARNRAAVERHDTSSHIVLVGDDQPLSGISKWMSKIRAELGPASAPYGMARALKTDEALSNLVRSADIIEFQWSENSSLFGYVRRLNRRARQVVVMHDVLTQKYRRRITTAQGIKQRIRALIAYSCSSFLEPRRLRRLDEVIVLSDKDLKLVASSGTHARISVVAPPLTAAAGVDQVRRIPFNVLFTGAMDRPENDQGIRWFIQHCWPQILKAHPSATLTVAGALPSADLLRLTSTATSISITGYVPDLDSYYTNSSVFIVPLFQGAGVKFKTISAMLNGMPVVSTPIGAEGVGELSLFGAITDNPDSFAGAVISLLEDEHQWTTISNRSSTWASANYGLEKFHDALDKTYNSSAINNRSSH